MVVEVPEGDLERRQLRVGQQVAEQVVLAPGDLPAVLAGRGI